jgi:tRNA threonylcarbamoyl adenosine modification protein (Sua5/YciO/YrdC/YwlC family)
VTQRFYIHPQSPQQRLISQTVAALQKGCVIAYPTDSAYALGCQLDDKEAQERIRRIRELDEKHYFTLVCRDLSEVASYAQVDNPVFRLLKAHTPGPYTFILLATHEVPRRLLNPKRKTVGLRVPENTIALAILEELQQPLLSVTLVLPGDEHPLADPDEIYERLDGKIDILVDGGPCQVEMTTIVDLMSGTPQVLRVGRGSIEAFI